MLFVSVMKWFCLTLTLLALMTGSVESVQCYACDKEDASHPCNPATKTDPCAQYPVCFSISEGTSDILLKKCADEPFATLDLKGTIGQCVEVDGPTITAAVGSVNPAGGRRRRSPEEGSVQITGRANFVASKTYTVCLCDSKDLCNADHGKPGDLYHPKPNQIPTTTTIKTTTTTVPPPESDELSVGALHSRSNFVIGAMAMAVISAGVIRNIFGL